MFQIEVANARAGPCEGCGGKHVVFGRELEHGAGGILRGDEERRGIRSAADGNDDVVAVDEVAQFLAVGCGPTGGQREIGEHRCAKDGSEALDGGRNVLSGSKEDGTTTGGGGNGAEGVVHGHGDADDVQRTSEAAGFFGDLAFVADLAVSDEEDGGVPIRAVFADFFTDMTEGGKQLGASAGAEVADFFAVGTEVEVGGADEFAVVVVDVALEECDPHAGIGSEAGQEGGKSLARAIPVGAVHAAGAVEEAVDIRDVY